MNLYEEHEVLCIFQSSGTLTEATFPVRLFMNELSSDLKIAN